jgi:STE24 endopeptidase
MDLVEFIPPFAATISGGISLELVELIPPLAAAILIARWLAETALGALNQRHVQAHAAEVPAAFRDTVTPDTYRNVVAYTLAKLRFGRWEDGWSTVVGLAALFSGLFPWSLEWVQGRWGESAWAGAAWLFGVGLLLTIPGLPFDWWSQFRLEQRFGFNTTTPKLWWLDRVKGLLLAAVLGYPLLVLIVKLFGWMGTQWWLWAWGAMMAFQLVMMVLAPVVILPLFNKLTPLAEGSLRDRLLKLGERTGFSAKTIFVMDGSKRSRHSNAFFTGFGRFRKIVLFDTLIAQLSEPELEAVLAHEVGHYKRGHIPKMLVWGALSSLAGFWVVAVLARSPWFTEGFGFAPDSGIAPTLLLFALLSGAVTFWLSPLTNLLSRRHEFEADAYAAKAMGEAASLVGALRKLTEKNLSNLTPHPLFSAWHYSHPTLLERETAVKAVDLSAP